MGFGCGIIKLSQHQRYICSIVITVITLIQISIGVSLFCSGAYITRTAATKLFSEKAEIIFVFTTIAMYGVNVMLQYSVALYVCYQCYKKSHKKSTKTLLLMWAISSCNTVVNGIILAALAVKTSKHIVRSLRHSLQRGIEKYLWVIDWKFAIDRLQQNLECCGITGYHDWEHIVWIPKAYMKNDSYVLQKFNKYPNGYLLPTVPWSCCKIDSEVPCFHDQFQQLEYLQIFQQNRKLMESSLNTVGCLDVLRLPIQNELIFVIIGDIMLFFLQLISTAALRLLYVSSKNAVILGDSTGIAPGWILAPKGRHYIDKLNKIMGTGTGIQNLPKTSPNVGRSPLSTMSPQNTRSSNRSPISAKHESASVSKEPVSSDVEAALLLG